MQLNQSWERLIHKNHNNNKKNMHQEIKKKHKTAYHIIITYYQVGDNVDTTVHTDEEKQGDEMVLWVRDDW